MEDGKGNFFLVIKIAIISFEFWRFMLCVRMTFIVIPSLKKNIDNTITVYAIINNQQ